MSQDKPSNGKRSLKILDKSMMPEILPDPMQAKARVGAGSPRDRVLKRFVQITERAAAIAAAATMSAACSDTHTGGNLENNGGGSGMVGAGSGGVAASGGGAGAGRGGAGAGSGGIGVAGYGVVDPLPDPAGSGGFGPPPAGSSGGTGGVGGTAGYGVVDPLPPPFMCPEDPTDLIDITALVWSGNSIEINGQPHNPDGYYAESLTMVQVGDDIAANIEQSGTPFIVRLDPVNGIFPIMFDIYLGFTCNGIDGVVNYQIGLTISTGFGPPTYVLIPNDNDGGM